MNITKDKNIKMLEEQISTLKSFFERNAITKEDYEKGMKCMRERISKEKGEI